MGGGLRVGETNVGAFVGSALVAGKEAVMKFVKFLLVTYELDVSYSG